MARLTNHYFPATTHRVVNPDGDVSKERMSLPFFVHAHPEAILDPNALPQIANKSGKEIPKPITAHEFLVQRLKEIGLIKN